MPLTKGDRFIKLRTDFEETLDDAMDAKGFKSKVDVDIACGLDVPNPENRNHWKTRLNNLVWRVRQNGTTTTGNDYITSLEHVLGVRLRDNNQGNKHVRNEPRKAWLEITSSSIRGTTQVDLVSGHDIVNVATFTGYDKDARGEASVIAQKWAITLAVDVDVMYLPRKYEPGLH